MDEYTSYVPNVYFEKIPIKNLVSNQEYQRSLSQTHVERAAENFDLYQINPVKVSRRDGINYVFNGQHTIEIVALVSGSRETPVWCMIYDDLNYSHEAEIFANQMKKSATSRVSMFATCHRQATELLMELMEDTGLVSYVGKVNMDREAPDTLCETTEESEDETARWLENTVNKFDNTKPIITPRFVPSCTDELMEKLRDIQTKYGVAVQSHVSENLGEIEFVHQLRPNNKFYGEVYDEYNMFGLNHNNGSDVKTIMAHCIWSCDEEIEMMKKQNVFVVHCPASNTNVVAGIAPIRKYIEAGLKIGLGSDVAGGQTESMFRAITDAIQVSKLRWRLVDQGDKPLTFAESFYLATKGGGEFFGKVGSFEEGYEFDAVILDDSHCPHPQELTIAERLERAAYLSADLNGIKAKYVAGKKVF